MRNRFSRGYGNSLLPQLFAEHKTRAQNSVEIKSIKDLFDNVLCDLVISRQPIVYPHHLKPYLDYLEKALDEDVEIVFAAPPRHGKTVASVAAFLYYHMIRPGLSHKYVTFSGLFAKTARDKFVMMLNAAKVKYHQSGGMVTIISNEGNTYVEFGSYKILTGKDVSGVIVMDDLIKNHEAATSITIKDNIWNEIETGAFTRKQQRMSIIAMGTRWAIDDPQGRLIDLRQFKYINLKAICEDEEADAKLGLDRKLGQPLNEHLVKLETLEREQRLNPPKFAAMYQGEPRLAGDKFFGELVEHSTAYIQNHTTKTTYGLDLAYAAKEKAKADWNVCVRLVRDYTDDVDRVDDVLRFRGPYDEFLPMVKKFRAQRPGKIRWHPSGMERGATRPEVLRTIPDLDVSFVASKAKHIRAQNVADRSKAGKLSTPINKSEAIIEFEKCLDRFTGVGDQHDDDIDALASAESLLPKFCSPAGALPQDRQSEATKQFIRKRMMV